MWKLHTVRRLETSCLHVARSISTAVILCKSHYDVLGLTPKATHSDIKAAYYKLSMVYHPDKNKGVDASATFRDITAAYEVLGNYKLRKLYDRGLLHTAGADQAAHVHENPEDRFYQSRASRHTAPPPSGQTPIYDFDEWARQHYGRSFAKRTAAKARWMESERYKVEKEGDIQSETTMYLILTSLALVILFTFSVSETHDVDRSKDLASPRSDT
ncbi:dnaJ homolog subfamily C member 30, mitochondrial [Ischnura elegans]|uniref:dnaJ homolog subfamily C member 30, mitochondrial n=1 Tax=Ischnura elegans TaxID=197161 RepID=UPI001ED86B50|nr:dnaJ homolog subfamily C member 30, mitochondrial [Ischnura elegans]